MLYATAMLTLSHFHTVLTADEDVDGADETATEVNTTYVIAKDCDCKCCGCHSARWFSSGTGTDGQIWIDWLLLIAGFDNFMHNFRGNSVAS